MEIPSRAVDRNARLGVLSGLAPIKLPLFANHFVTMVMALGQWLKTETIGSDRPAEKAGTFGIRGHATVSGHSAVKYMRDWCSLQGDMRECSKRAPSCETQPR